MVGRAPDYAISEGMVSNGDCLILVFYTDGTQATYDFDGEQPESCPGFMTYVRTVNDMGMRSDFYTYTEAGTTTDEFYVLISFRPMKP